mgnify:CR=1 FL=1
MREMTKEEQMEKNGGYTWHCHACNRNFKAINKNYAGKDAREHVNNLHKGATAIWDYGMIEGCRNS